MRSGPDGFPDFPVAGFDIDDPDDFRGLNNAFAGSSDIIVFSPL